MRQLIRALFILVAFVNLLPVLGVLGTPRLEALYGLRFEGNDLVLLMRHHSCGWQVGHERVGQHLVHREEIANVVATQEFPDRH